MIPIQLTCEYQTDPIGIDGEPSFSWVLSSDRRGAVQATYRILVSSSPGQLANDDGDKWDSGVVESHHSANVGVPRSSTVHRRALLVEGAGGRAGWSSGRLE